MVESKKASLPPVPEANCPANQLPLSGTSLGAQNDTCSMKKVTFYKPFIFEYEQEEVRNVW